MKVAGNKKDIQSAREIIDRELFQPAGHSLKESNDIAEKALYVVAKKDNKVIGAGRLSLSPTIEWSNSFWKALDQSLSFDNYKPEEFKDKVAVMYGLVLDGNYRGQGIGSKLYDLRESIAQKNMKHIIVSRIRPDSWNIYSNRSYILFGSEEIKLTNNEVVVRKWVYKII